jgi:hypothetical protein
MGKRVVSGPLFLGWTMRAQRSAGISRPTKDTGGGRIQRRSSEVSGGGAAPAGVHTPLPLVTGACQFRLGPLHTQRGGLVAAKLIG